MLIYCLFVVVVTGQNGRRVVDNWRLDFPPSTNKTYGLGVQFRARRDTQFRSREFIDFFTTYYSNLLSTESPAIPYVSSPLITTTNASGEVEISLTRGQSFSVELDVTYSVGDISTIFNIQSLLEGTSQMEVSWSRHVLNRNFLLETQSPIVVNPVSLCTANTCPSYFDCHEPDPALPSTICRSVCLVEYCANEAICEHRSSSSPPQCFCQDGERVWYFGRRCERVLWDWQLYLIIAFVAILFIIVLAILVYLLCRACRTDSKKSQGETYVPNFTVSEMAQSTSDDSSTLDYQLKRGYSDSMINAMDQSSNEQNDSGISAEGQSLTPGLSNERSVDKISQPEKNVTNQGGFVPRPGWVPSLGPSQFDLNQLKQRQLNIQSSSPLDTNV